ncbi:MAG: transglutaminase domain-containing protein [Deltaproteobacteria bacterium]|nr:transglutaminase domain-containing protein [Deltaproteobacteria bacterium]
MKKYLEPTFTIDCNSERIITTARELTESCGSDREKALKLFYFVRDSVRYNLYMISVFIEDFKASRVLAWGKGYCVQKAVLLTALGRAAGIPSRMAFAMIRNHQVPPHVLEKRNSNIFPRHGYNQFFLDGQWISAAATFDRGLCERNGLPTVEFDGLHDAMLPSATRDGRPYIEYLEKFPPRDDLPFDWIRDTLVTIVGPDKRPWLNKEAQTQRDGASSGEKRRNSRKETE